MTMWALVLLAWDFWLSSAGGIKRLFQLFETLCFKKRQKLGILWPNIAKIGASGKSQAARASSWFFSWFTWATELLVLAFLMKILSVFGDFWDEPIKNDQKNIITDLLGYEKSHASNTSDLYRKKNILTWFFWKKNFAELFFRGKHMYLVLNINQLVICQFEVFWSWRNSVRADPNICFFNTDVLYNLNLHTFILLRCTLYYNKS